MISCYISFLFIVISESVISHSVISISFFWLYQIPLHQILLYQFPFSGYISFRYIRVRYINFLFLLHQIPLYQFPGKMLHHIPLYQIPLYQLPHPLGERTDAMASRDATLTRNARVLFRIMLSFEDALCCPLPCSCPVVRPRRPRSHPGHEMHWPFFSLLQSPRIAVVVVVGALGGRGRSIPEKRL